MSLPSDAERKQLDQVADNLREVFSERGHRVDVALDADPAFGSGSSRSSLVRDLVMATVSHSAGQFGLYFQPVNGAGRELVGDGHRYRIRHARRDVLGNLIVTISSESALANEEEPSLFPKASWLFGWSVNADFEISEVFIAPILGVIPGTPGRLVLGRAIPLGTDSALGGGFNPTSEDLDLGIDDEGDLDQLGA